jgi:hypothetical protein
MTSYLPGKTHVISQSSINEQIRLPLLEVDAQTYVYVSNGNLEKENVRVLRDQL